MKISVAILLIISSIALQTSAKQQNKESQLFLVGGGLKTCTSMSKNNCNSNVLSEINQLSNIKHSALYQVNQKTMNLFNDSWPSHFKKDTKKKILEILERSSQNNSLALLDTSSLTTLLKKHDKQKIISTLSDPEYFLMLDLLEQPVINLETNIRLKEHVELIHSTNYFSTEIYKNFVFQAQINSEKEQPNIIVITASGRDTFEAADFYQTVFDQAGANTQWLPLDATLNELMQRSGDRQSVCQQLSPTRLKVQGSINREFVYPDLVEKQMQACLQPKTVFEKIEQADGLFINGGDQSLTLKAFIKNDGSDTEILTLIKQKLSNGYFVVGGTSAGTAVMSGGVFAGINNPMITNGESSVAIIRGAKKDQLPIEGCQKSKLCDKNLLDNDLTYRSKGGLGLFHWGIMDTHFSERGRQGRLVKLVTDTNTAFAFGVDEATALVVGNLTTDNPTFNVMGQSGVFVVENSNATATNTNVENTIDAQAETSVITHYISRDDTANIKDTKFTLNIAPWKNTDSETIKIPENTKHIFDGKRYQQTAELLCRSTSKVFFASDNWKNHRILIETYKQEESQQGFGAVRINGVDTGYCSYKNYSFSFPKYSN